MGKKKKCSSCGQEFELSKKEKMQRKITISLLKSIGSAIPQGEFACEEHKNDCFKCFRKGVLDTIGPAAQSMLGQQMEEAEEDPGVRPGPGKVLKADPNK